MIFKGMFTAGSRIEQKPIIDFYIVSPSRKILYNARKKNEGMFNIPASEPGQYSFVFSNLRVRIYFLLTCIEVTV